MAGHSMSSVAFLSRLNHRSRLRFSHKSLPLMFCAYLTFAIISVSRYPTYGFSTVPSRSYLPKQVTLPKISVLRSCPPSNNRRAQSKSFSFPTQLYASSIAPGCVGGSWCALSSAIYSAKAALHANPSFVLSSVFLLSIFGVALERRTTAGKALSVRPRKYRSPQHTQ